MLASLNVSELYHVYGFEVSSMLMETFRLVFYIAALASVLVGAWKLVRSADIAGMMIRFFMVMIVLVLMQPVSYNTQFTRNYRVNGPQTRELSVPLAQLMVKRVTDAVIVVPTEKIAQEGVHLDYANLVLASSLPDEGTSEMVRTYNRECYSRALLWPDVHEEVRTQPLGERSSSFAQGLLEKRKSFKGENVAFAGSLQEYDRLQQRRFSERLTVYPNCVSFARGIRERIRAHLLSMISASDWRSMAPAPQQEDAIINEYYRRIVSGLGRESFYGGKRDIVPDLRLKVVDVEETDPEKERGFFEGIGYWAKRAVNDLWDNTLGAAASVTTEIGEQWNAKAARYKAQLFGLWFWGMCQCIVVITFPFFCVSAFIDMRALLWYLKLYMAVAVWPLFWQILYAFYGVAGEHLQVEDRAALLSYPYIFLIVPIISFICINSAMSFVQDGVTKVFAGAVHINASGGGFGQAAAVARTAASAGGAAASAL